MPSAHEPARPVILTTAMGYRRDALSPFVSTCLRHLPEATIVVFTSGLDRATLDWLRAQPRVETIMDRFNPYHVPRGWRLAAGQLRTRLAFHLAHIIAGRNGAGSGHEARERLAESLFSVAIQRFFRYRRLLAEEGHRFTHALLADIRDVVFQADPFPCEGLHAFAENESIGRNHFARRWFQLAYGWSSWRRWSDRPLLNVGTILGDIAHVRRYLDIACAEYVRRLAFFWGADTAVHNHILHSGLLPATLHPFGSGPVLTLNAVPVEALRVEDGRVLDSRGNPFPVLHQYDRVKNLALAVEPPGGQPPPPGRP